MGEQGGGEDDHISQLPDHLMHRVFSFMPTKDVVKFCTLSRRWRHCCTDVQSMDFHASPRTSIELHRFTTFMNGFLGRCSSDKLERFSLRLDRPCGRICARIDPWVRFAVRRKVKELCLDLESYELPRFVRYCFRLESLRIAHCTSPGRGDRFVWHHLRELSMSQMELSEDVLRNIIYGSHHLELLKLEGCWGLKKIDTSTSTRLRELVVDSHEAGGHGLKIIAPSLRLLRLRGHWRCQELKLVDVSSVAEAELDFLLQVMEDDGDDDNYLRPPQFFISTFKDILDRLQHVSALHIGYWCNEVVSSMKEAGVCIRKMANCKHLTIDSMLDEVDLIGIAALLESSPHVEKLELRRRLHGDIDYELDPRKREPGPDDACPDDRDKFCRLPRGGFEGLEKYLKHVKTVVLRWSDAATGRGMSREPLIWGMEWKNWFGQWAPANLKPCAK